MVNLKTGRPVRLPTEWRERYGVAEVDSPAPAAPAGL
jgi:hypothetical protein